MRTLAALVAEAEGFGFRVALSRGAPQLVPYCAGARLPGALLSELKARRGELIAALCGSCGRLTEDPEDRARLAGSAFCDRADCPYKRTTT